MARQDEQDERQIVLELGALGGGKFKPRRARRYGGESSLVFRLAVVSQVRGYVVARQDGGGLRSSWVAG